LKISTKGCTSSPQTLEQNYQKFVEQDQKASAEQQKFTSTTYTITN